MKKRFRRAASRSLPLTAPCGLISAAILTLSLAEAALRWDAMAPPVRVIFRLIGTGKLTAGEIFEAVRPEITSGALTYPLCVLLCALCGLWGLGTVLARRRGFAAAAMYLGALALTFLSGGGTALRTVHLSRCVVMAAAGCLYAARAFLFRPPVRRGPEGEKIGEGTGKHGARQDEGGDRAGSGEGRLFGVKKRRTLFRDENERPRLFDRQDEKNRRGRN